MKNIRQRIQDAIELENFVTQRAREILFIRRGEEDNYVDSCSFYPDSVSVMFCENTNSDCPDHFRIDLTLGELILSEKDWETYKKALQEELEGARKREEEFEQKKRMFEQLELVKKTAKELGFELIPKRVKK